MDGVKTSSSPFADATSVPLQRNPPLAPSQELAYRNKCIQLKKRLSEIESNNDNTRRRISAEKERVQKQRLLRSLLLNQLREIMETPGKKFKPEELERLGIVINGDADDEDQSVHGRHRPEGEVLLDDSSENSDDEIPEPSDRPTRVRRQGQNYRGEAMMNTQVPPISTPFAPTGLPAIAPANPYSPSAAREPLPTSSFPTPSAQAGSPIQYQAHPGSSQNQFVQDPRYAPSSPIHARQQQLPPAELPPLSQTPAGTAVRSLSSTALPQPQESPPQDPNGFRPPSVAAPRHQPPRPSAPYNQFCDHMRPQLEADNYPREHIQSRIDEEWRKLSHDNRSLWDERYQDQMKEYEEQMDAWKRASRRPGEGAVPVGDTAEQRR